MDNMDNISDNMKQINDLHGILTGMQKGHKWGTRNFIGKLEASIDQSLSTLLICHKHNIVKLIPKTILCNGIEISAPETDSPKLGEMYYVASTAAVSGVEGYTWGSVPAHNDITRLTRRVVHLTRDAAIAHTSAMLTTTYK